MKTIIQVLGDVQPVFEFDFDYRFLFDDFPTEEHMALVNIFRIIFENKYLFDKEPLGRGRPSISRRAIYRSFIAKSVLQISSNRKLINRLKSDRNLRKICGFMIEKKVPSESTLSRAFNFFSEEEVNQKIHTGMIKENVSGILIGHISRDSTAIHAREKPANKKKNVKTTNKRRRGRPKKGEIVEPKEEPRIKRQVNQTPEEALAEINKDAAWGCKKNSQGKLNHWKGYKLHLDVNDFGLPITAVLTGANVYDNQLAIPMEKITENRVTSLYSLMDAAYDAGTIREYIKSRDRIPIIDHNKRRSKKVDFTPAEKERYKNRSVVERSNAHLKDWLFGPAIYVKGNKKVMQHLMFGVVVLTAIKILQYIIKPESFKKVS
ncbi:MAG: transposase [Candidatus Sabulitectum sp.]|nr:transposase [Candidatus Sabulitectum sp.]